MGKLVKFERKVNGVLVEQRSSDGFINATAMAVAHGKDISDWLKTGDTWELVVELARDLGIQINSDFYPNSVKTRVSASYPSLVSVRRGSPENGGGTWIHPDLAVPCASWCNKAFAIQVSRWIREWLTTGRNPFQPDVDDQLKAWQLRHDFRVRLKDVLRPELMNAVVAWAEANGKSPRTVCSEVHDLMNERIQGARSQQISTMGGLPLGVLIRDYFDAHSLVLYSSINMLVKNAIVDRGLDPIMAVHEACDSFLGRDYEPKLAKIEENVHLQGRKLKAFRRKRQLSQGVQLNLFNENQAI